MAEAGRMVVFEGQILRPDILEEVTLPRQVLQAQVDAIHLVGLA